MTRIPKAAMTPKARLLGASLRPTSQVLINVSDHVVRFRSAGRSGAPIAESRGSLGSTAVVFNLLVR